MKKLLILLAIAISLTLAFVSCGETEEPVPTPSAPSSSTQNSDTGSSKNDNTAPDSDQSSTLGSTENGAGNEDNQSSVSSITNTPGNDPEITPPSSGSQNPGNDPEITPPAGGTENPPSGDEQDPSDNPPPPPEDDPVTPPEDELTVAPDIKIVNANGEDVQLHFLLGKPIVLNFWATWCPPCVYELPGFETAYKAYGSEINFVMVNLDAEFSDGKSYFSSKGYTMPIYHDSYLEGSNAYEIASIPQTFILTSQGELFKYFDGGISEETLDNALLELIEKEGIEILGPEPVHQDLVLSVNGVSDYTIVYDSKDDSAAAFAKKFADYLKTVCKITMPTAPYNKDSLPEHCVFIGNVPEAGWTKKKLNDTNDFGACVSGDDYILYATNGRLYNYLLEGMKTYVFSLVRNGNWSTQPRRNFIYSNSELKDKSYVEYLLSKNNGAVNQDTILELFEARSFVASDGTELVYRFYAPFDYDESKEYPFLTFLHGAGERGNNNTGNVHHMFVNLFSLENSPFWDCIIIAPQCPNGQQWVDTPWINGGYKLDEVPVSNELSAVVEIIDRVESTYPTDKDRYYVAGLSMGGFGTWDMIMRFPNRFAGAVPLCGGADESQAPNLLDMPIYTIHSINDPTVPSEGTSGIMAALKALGAKDVTYEKKPGYDHNVWDYASKKAEIWTWLFEQNKSN